MLRLQRLFFLLTSASLLVAAPAVAAEWTIVPDGSELSFVSVKNGDVPVSGRFPGVSGTVSDGETIQGEMNIALDSLDTGNPGRDQNILEAFFRVATAGKVARFELLSAKKVADGTPERWQVEGTLHLVGATHKLSFPVELVRLSRTERLLVTPASVPIRFADFGLTEAAADLRKRCNHQELLELATVQARLLLRRK